MIILKFSQSNPFDTSSVPSEWRDRISVTHKMLLNRVPVYIISIEILCEDSSYRYRALMERPQLVLKFNLPYYVEFPLGTSCTYQGQTYYLNDPQNFKKNGTKKIEYTMTMGTTEDNMSLYKVRNTVDGRLKFSMCAKPHEFIEMIVANLNERDGDIWLCDKAHIIDSTEKTIEFNHTYIADALSSIADTFETEYEIIESDGTFEICLHKVEYFKDDPLPLSYGRGNGFVPGVGRTTESDGKPIKKLYVQGGDTNIDRSKYGEEFEYSNNPAELRLPKSQSLEYEGRTYTSDEEGYYIERTDETSKATKEDSLDCDEIYPSFVGVVSSVEVPNADKNFYDIIDLTIPENLNFNDNLIEGESMTIIFQSGMLAGNDKEFEVKYKHAERRWEIVPQEIDGVTMPNETFKPAENDTYAVFGIYLPKEYICDNDSQTGAAWDMFREAAQYLYEHEEQKFTFSGELQALYAKKNWLKIGGYLKVGAYIHFTDDQFAVDGVDIRIIGIKDYINSPYSPTIEISNSIQSPTTASSQLAEIPNTEVTIADTKKQIINYTKRRFRDALETLSMLEDAQLENFTNSINPIALQTMQLLVGDENLQFSLGLTLQTIGAEDYVIGYNESTKQFHADAGWLQHYTIGINSITATRNSDNTTYLTWPMKSYDSPVLAESSKAYYVYAVVNRQDETQITQQGEFIISETAVAMRQYAGYYYLLVGIISSEFEGTRSFEKMYGFTEVLPGRITTDIIKSTDGKTYFDLVNGIIAGTIKFINADGKLEDVVTLNSNLLEAIKSGDTDSVEEAVKKMGETIIEGGYIKTELINASVLVANEVLVKPQDEDDKRKITISPDTMSLDIYDTDENICTTFEGISHDDVTSLFGDSSGDLTIMSRTSTIYGYDTGVTYGRGYLPELYVLLSNTSKTVEPDLFPIAYLKSDGSKWHTDTPTEVIISKGFLHADVYAEKNVATDENTLTMNSSATASITLYVVTYDDENYTNQIEKKSIASVNASAYPNTLISEKSSMTVQKDLNISSNPVSVKVCAGYHRLEMKIYQNVAGNANNKAYLQWGYADGTHDDIMSASYKSDFYVSRFFANGFCLGERKDNYVAVMKTDNGMQFACMNGNYGFMCGNDGVKTTLNGSKWLQMPMLAFHGRAIYSSSSTSYSFDSNTISYDDNKPTLSRNDQGKIRITFPSSWGAFSLSKFIVNVIGASPISGGTNPNKAQIYAISSSYIDITISDDASPNDGDFILDLYKIG